ncbi:MAG: ABC transporter ATP-binding protein [Gammaproteobacteria bacterium]|nr:ABC transporter ATP-binding protein [Gammaproteobacteria bacterium]
MVAREDRPVNDSPPSPLVQIREVTKKFGGVTAVDRVSLDILRGELFAILGSSGCGKTTLLRLLAGFEEPTSGRILIDGADMTDVPPYERPVNLMFQSYALFPHMTVAQNVAYGLKKEHVPADRIRERVAEMLALVKLEALAGRKPEKLSGGEKQRVALARALVKRPKLLLLDEPMAALDKKLRQHTQFELANLQYQLGTTFVVVTHDQSEAMTLASRIAVMAEGRIAQVGTPGQVYEFPANRYVASFVGNINLFDGRVTAAGNGQLSVKCETLGSDELSVISGGEIAPGSTVCIAVRPEKITISRQAPEARDRNVIKGTVWDLAYFGDQSLYRVRLKSGAELQVSAQNLRRSEKMTVEWDDEVFLSWEVASTVLLQS